MKRTGFIDLQINGYKNINFSTPGLTIEQVRTVTRELLKAGTVAYCPTVITSPVNLYSRNLPVLAQAMQDPECSPHILGIHLEGPYISPEEGARGAHTLECIIKPDINMFQDLQKLAEGKIVFLTLAPETDGALPLIRYASDNGVVVSLGHHLADDDILERAVQAGAQACTHLGNGIVNMIHRHQNPIWWQLASDKLYGMFITDGHHLPIDFIKVALRAKTSDRFIVVSDAMHFAGMPPGKYEFQDTFIVLSPSGRISFADTPYLAGSSATMLQCMNFLASLHMLSEKELWKVGFDNPLKLLGRDPELFSKNSGPAVEFHDNQFVISTG